MPNLNKTPVKNATTAATKPVAAKPGAAKPTTTKPAPAKGQPLPGSASKKPNQAEAPAQAVKKSPVPAEISLKAINNIIFSDDNSSSTKWPLMIDPSERVSAFLRHRDSNILNAMSLDDMKAEKVRVKLISAIRYGKPFVIDFMDTDKTLLDNI